VRQCPVCNEIPSFARLALRGTCSHCGVGLSTSLLGLPFFIAYAIAAAVTPRGLPLFEHVCRFALVGVPIVTGLYFAAISLLPLRKVEKSKLWRDHSANEKLAVGMLLFVILTVVAFAVLRRA